MVNTQHPGKEDEVDPAKKNQPEFDQKIREGAGSGNSDAQQAGMKKSDLPQNDATEESGMGSGQRQDAH